MRDESDQSDGSDDDTETVLEQIVRSDSRVKYHFIKHAGAAEAVEVGSEEPELSLGQVWVDQNHRLKLLDVSLPSRASGKDVQLLTGTVEEGQGSRAQQAKFNSIMGAG